MHGDDMLCGYENSNAGEILFAERRMPQANAESELARLTNVEAEKAPAGRAQSGRRSIWRSPGRKTQIIGAQSQDWPRMFR